MNGEDKVQNAINSLVEEVSSLRHQLEEEQEKNRKNQEEWDSFFREARLKNPITGEPILSREDFYRFKEQELEKRSHQIPTAQSPRPAPKKAQGKTVAKNYAGLIIVSVLAVLFLIGAYLLSKDDTLLESVPSKNQTAESQTNAPQYFGSINSELVHKRTCNHARNILFKNRVYYDTISEALADGRKRCSSCLPTSSEGGSTGAVSTNSRASSFVRRAVEEERRRKNGIKQNPNLPQG